MTIKKENIYAIALTFIKGLGPVLYKALIDRFGYAEHVFRASSLAVPLVGKLLENLQNEEKALLIRAEKLLIAHKKKGIKIISYGSKAYPKRLAMLHAPPSLLYCNDSLEILDDRMVSIVGTRHPSAYGEVVTKRLVEQLKKYNPIIVSGLAYGIDQVAHEAALVCGLRTIGILGGGIDWIYPASHSKLVDNLIKNKGGIISEHKLGIRPTIHRFPARNRVIAGLSGATIVVEAPVKSGAMITAYYANDFNREVFAVPNHLDAKHAKGCHQLIKNNYATLITHGDDLAYMMQWSDPKDKGVSIESSLPSLNSPALTPPQKAFIALLKAQKDYIMTVDALSTALSIEQKHIKKIALELEIENVIEISGNQYRLSAFV